MDVPERISSLLAQLNEQHARSDALLMGYYAKEEAMTFEGQKTAADSTPEVAAIEARSVNKSFGEGESTVQVLKGVDLVVAKGEMLAIMGPSGSGKSTLLGCLSGLDSVTDGQVIINGTEPDRYPYRSGKRRAADPARPARPVQRLQAGTGAAGHGWPLAPPQAPPQSDVRW
jgi:ABC-type glutathione transport system ATPase component